ncbi:MAG: hypothetical protein AAFU78_19060 [Cyanobacteria bacterium J06633_2]
MVATQERIAQNDTALINVIQINSTEFADAVSYAKRFVLRSRTTQGVSGGLDKIHLNYQAREPYLFVSGFDLAKGATISIPAYGESDLDVLLESGYTEAIAKAMPQDFTLDITQEEGSILIKARTTTGILKRRIPYLSPENRTLMPTPAGEAIASVDYEQILQASEVCFCYEQQVEHDVMSCIRLSWSLREFCAESSNKHVIAHFQDDSSPTKACSVLIPGNSLKVFAAVLKRIEPTQVDIYYQNNCLHMIAFKDDYRVAEIYSGSMNAQFPDMKAVVDAGTSNPTTEITANKELLVQALQRIRPATETALEQVAKGVVQIETLGTDKLKITAPCAAPGCEAMEIIACQATGEALKKNIKYEYLMPSTQQTVGTGVRIVGGAHPSTIGVLPMKSVGVGQRYAIACLSDGLAQ